MTHYAPLTKYATLCRIASKAAPIMKQAAQTVETMTVTDYMIAMIRIATEIPAAAQNMKPTAGTAGTMTATDYMTAMIRIATSSAGSAIPMKPIAGTA